MTECGCKIAQRFGHLLIYSALRTMNTRWKMDKVSAEKYECVEKKGMCGRQRFCITGNLDLEKTLPDTGIRLKNSIPVTG